MRPKTFLISFTALCVTASVSFAQTRAAERKAPASTPATAMTPPATTSSPAAPPTNAAATTTTSSTMPSADEMKQMMEMGKLNENHKILAATAGTFSYVVKMYMDPSGKPNESTGTATRKVIMDGRYVAGDYSGNFKMPGPDGKMQTMKFIGMSMDGYDNVKKKFVSGWVDNMGTGIMM